MGAAESFFSVAIAASALTPSALLSLPPSSLPPSAPTSATRPPRNLQPAALYRFISISLLDLPVIHPPSHLPGCIRSSLILSFSFDARNELVRRKRSIGSGGLRATRINVAFHLRFCFFFFVRRSKDSKDGIFII